MVTEIEFALEEFKTLREEISNKNDRCYQILSLGIGGITIILGFVFQYGIYDLFFFLPLLILANAYLYNSEQTAIVHAGSYIKKLENIIYRKCGTTYSSDKGRCDKDKLFEDMGWENYLKRGIYKPIMYAANVIFFVLYLICIVEAWENSKNPLKSWLIILLLIIGYIFFGIFFYSVRKLQA